jgi:hypothetical protein
MASPYFGKRSVFLLPAVLLTVALLEDVAMYKIRQHVREVRLRTLLDLLLFGAAFAVAADWLTPRLRQMLTTVRRQSRREAGSFGLAVFYALAYGALYYAYLVRETRGVGALLPAWLR